MKKVGSSVIIAAVLSVGRLTSLPLDKILWLNGWRVNEAFVPRTMILEGFILGALILRLIRQLIPKSIDPGEIDPIEH